ncbi:hypothetical protein TRAPUB_14449 [Trametes pubescens]|uniref:Uncharacterized protein n=1 Tax=Trametes pubescens TaxID=154538 RepID=A0A1M2VNK7_TRAPU|nr:hypothetical protein TRAPUB_14449 [Trametes pubescens]
MFSEHRLDSPPPTSRFRRPWSPDPYDPLPSTSNLRSHGFEAPNQGGYYAAERRREPSDVSVEALDLADYAHTLNRNEHYLAQHPPFQPYDPYPPSPQPFRPLARTDSLSPPSLVSASASSSQSHSFSPRSPVRRPFSLPPPSFPTRSHHSDPSSAHWSRPRQEPQIASPGSEIDIAQFPSFARGWYAQDRPGPQHPLSPPTLLDDRGAKDQPKPSPFDPAYTFEHDPFHEPYSSPPPTYPYSSAYGSQSRYSRDQNMVPWGGDPPDGDRPINPETKEERMRMLEREFGGKGGPKDEGEAETMVGCIDQRGRLITQGPKKRLAVRWVQALLALTAAISSIYAALIIKPPSPAPPANKLPAYLLYVLSVLTFLGCTFLFLIYPCCCGARKQKGSPYMAGPSGMMVLPVQGFPGGKHKKKGKKGKGGQGEGVQVNLIVDPSMFGRDRERGRDDDEEEDEDGAEALPGSYAGSSSAARQRRPPRRRGIFAGLAMEEQWKHARKMLKWGMTVDVLALLLWGTEFVVILLGKRCPVGAFEGW